MTEAFFSLNKRVRVRAVLRQYPDITMEEISRRTKIPVLDVKDVLDALHGYVEMRGGKFRLL